MGFWGSQSPFQTRKHGLPGIFLGCSSVIFQGDLRMYGNTLPSPWQRIVGKVVVQIRIPFLLDTFFFFFFFYMGHSHLGPFSFPLGCFGVWLNGPAWIHPRERTCAVYSDIVNTQIFITWCQCYGDIKTQIIGALYCGWSFGNITVSADKAAELSQHSTFPASPDASQTNPK